MEHTKNTKWHNVKQKSSTSSSTFPLNATTTHSSLALISFHGRGLEWDWMWSWTRRVTIQISYASGVVVGDIHVPSRPSEFDTNCISYLFNTYWTNPLPLLWRCDCRIINTPWESRSLFISTRALNVYLRYPERSFDTAAVYAEEL